MSNDHTGRHQKWIWALASVAAVVAIGWWGVRLTRQQGALGAASKPGGIAPEFALPSTAGGTITLSEFREKKHVLLYFHEGLSCDPCMDQIPELEKYLGDLEKMDVVLFSLAFDSIDQLREAAPRYNIQGPILSYQDARTEADYDLLRFSMGMGRRAGHTFILVGKDGKILWRKDYWPGRGHMVRGGRMFVEGSEILTEVEKALGT